MELLLVGTALAGTAVTAIGQYQAGQAQEAAGEANERMRQARAKQAEDEGRETTARTRTENRRRLASMRARMAAGGTTIAGSGLDFLGESARRLELKVQDISRATHIDAQNERYAGELAAWEGGVAKKAATIRSVGTLLTGVGKAGGMAYDADVFGVKTKAMAKAAANR